MKNMTEIGRREKKKERAKEEIKRKENLSQANKKSAQKK